MMLDRRNALGIMATWPIFTFLDITNDPISKTLKTQPVKITSEIIIEMQSIGISTTIVGYDDLKIGHGYHGPIYQF